MSPVPLLLLQSPPRALSFALTPCFPPFSATFSEVSLRTPQDLVLTVHVRFRYALVLSFDQSTRLTLIASVK